ncbi:MAG: hypothetical protein JWR15_4173 [Prosthecobacter sp.]|nr:hypothetical protein [Prosthecobacter sp.]
MQSAIAHFTRVEVCWLYVGSQDAAFPNSRRVGRSFLGGSLLRDLLAAPLLWAGWRSRELQQAAAALAAESADAFWFVAMNEGILVGNAFANASRKPFHVSVQDDQAEAICRRSRRYRWLEPLALRGWKKLTRRAGSVDVISTGMQDYYRQHRQLDSFVFHPYVPQLPPAPPALDDTELHVGHMGTLYSEPEVLAFMQGAALAARHLGRRLRLSFIGGNRIDPAKYADLLAQDVVIEVSPSLPEHEAMAKLVGCHLLYAMYPFEERCRVFRMTSLPTKLSSYIQLQRPIFAHTPADSTLADMVQRHSIGHVCASLDPAVIAEALQTTLRHTPAPAAFESMRASEYGKHHVTRLEDALLQLANSCGPSVSAGAF